MNPDKSMPETTHENPNLPSAPPLGSDWEKHIKLVASMASDAMLGRGPTPKAFISNLRLIATLMEEVLQSADSPNRYFLDKVPDWFKQHSPNDQAHR